MRVVRLGLGSGDQAGAAATSREARRPKDEDEEPVLDSDQVDHSALTPYAVTHQVARVAAHLGQDVVLV